MMTTTPAADPGTGRIQPHGYAERHAECHNCPFKVRATGCAIVRGPLRLQDHTAWWAGADVRLTAAEYRVVHLLVTAERPVNYREIYDVIQRPGFIAGCDGEGHRTNVRSMMKRIRIKFRRRGASSEIIENRERIGYVWLGT